MLIITGSMGAGKTSVMAEASDLLAARQVAHAAIDMDALGLAYLPTADVDSVTYDNLRSIWENYAALGVRRFLLARALETETELQLCRRIIPTANTAVCRLSAGIETMQRRVAARESGMLQPQFVARVEILEDILDHARLEDFVISNEDRPITDVALELLIRAGWISN